MGVCFLVFGLTGCQTNRLSVQWDIFSECWGFRIIGPFEQSSRLCFLTNYLYNLATDRFLISLRANGRDLMPCARIS